MASNQAEQQFEAHMRDRNTDSTDRSRIVGDRMEAAVRIREMVLLAGGVRAESLAARTGRSVLDLPLSNDLRIFDVWGRRIDEFSRGTGTLGSGLEVVVLASDATPLPRAAEARLDRPFRLERDTGDFRGTAGVLRDLCESFDDADHVVVGNASQCPDPGLLQHLVAHANPTQGVTISVAASGEPTGLMLVCCAALRLVPAVGYIDLKEQALPRIAGRFGAQVLESPVARSTPIRELESYLDAVRSWHLRGSLDSRRAGGPFEESWRPGFAVVEEGAHVAEGVQLHDSVVLRGGVVKAGAQLVRCVVGPGGVVARNARAQGRLILPGERGERRPSGSGR